MEATRPATELDIHDGAGAALSHGGQDGPDEAERPEDVGLVGEARFVVRGLLEHGEFAPTGVVHQHIDCPASASIAAMARSQEAASVTSSCSMRSWTPRFSDGGAKAAALRSGSRIVA